jgi:hypothetical protein
VAQKIAFLPTRNNIYRKVNFILPIIFTYLSVKIRLVPIYMDLPILRFHQLLSSMSINRITDINGRPRGYGTS